MRFSIASVIVDDLRTSVSPRSRRGSRCWAQVVRGAVRWAGLGSDFVVECSEALARIQRNPEWVGVDAYGVRSLRIRRFPYVIHYRMEGEMIVVFAIIFGGRDPTAWQERI